MAIGWLTALKLVPWGDVIEATPQAVKAARALLQKRKENQAEPTVDASGEVHITKAMLTQWRQEQVVALETIERLATTQMQLIAEIERLRQRQRQTSWMVLVLSIALVALIAWLIGQR